MTSSPLPRSSGVLTQDAPGPPRNSVRLHRERHGSLHGYVTTDRLLRVMPSVDNFGSYRGPWLITAIYEDHGDKKVRATEQAIDFHGSVWNRLADVREVIPDILSTRLRILAGRFEWPGNE